MPTLTSNFDFNKPLVNNATDADLWGGQLNSNWDDLDGYLSLNTESKNSTFTVGTDEFNKTFLVDSSGGNVTINLPAAANVFDGFAVRFKAVDVSNNITIDPNGSETIDGNSTESITGLNSTVAIVCDGSNWRKITGVSVATTSNAGIVELATEAEAQAGTATDKVVTPDNLGSTVIGIGQSWQDVSGSRTLNTNYTNSTGRPIMVAISTTSGATYDINVGGVKIANGGESASFVGSVEQTKSFIVPDGDSYQISGTGVIISHWAELR